MKYQEKIKLLRLPPSNQIEKINQILLEYLDKIIKENFENKNWKYIEIQVSRKIGHGTHLIKSIEKIIIFETGISKFDYDDINLARMISRVSKRTAYEKIKIKISVEGTIGITEKVEIRKT